MSPVRTRCPGVWSSWFPPGIRRLIVFANTNTSCRIFIAYASNPETGPGGSPGPAARRGSSRQARPGGVGGSAQGSRDADAPAANRPVKKTGVDLNDFDVVSQLAQAGGRLRMTDLAARAFSSRSGLTRRIDRLVEGGLVGPTTADGDARGVVVALTEAGVARVTETVPVHLRAVAELFVAKLDDQELAVLESALKKVILDRTFG